MNRRQIIIYSLSLFALAGGLGVWFVFGRGASGEAAQYFYDLSEKRLFPAPPNAFAPIDGVGGESGDGVEAVVVFCEACGRSSQRVAYLKTHTPEYKAKDEQSKAGNGLIEGLTRGYISKNTLVRKLDGGDWHTTDSKEGSAIVSGWRKRCSMHGQDEVVLRP